MKLPDEITITVRPFRTGTDKEAALKPLEEAAETFAEWQVLDYCLSSGALCKDCEDDGARNGCAYRLNLADGIADCVQACVNLAERYDVDLPAAMERCERRNRERGRYVDLDGMSDGEPSNTGISHDDYVRLIMHLFNEEVPNE